MNGGVFFIEFFVAITACAPPSVLDLPPLLQRIRNAGIEVEGRDPFAGTGLCGALLPVRVPNEVHYVTLPRKFDASDLRLVRYLSSVEQVRCKRTISDVEFELTRQQVGKGAWILCNVRTDDGIIRFGSRRWPGDLDEDLNGDGVVDEHDTVLAEQRDSK